MQYITRRRWPRNPSSRLHPEFTANVTDRWRGSKHIYRLLYHADRLICCSIGFAVILLLSAFRTCQ